MAYAGNSAETPWAAWSDPMERMTDRFNAKTGLQYTWFFKLTEMPPNSTLTTSKSWFMFHTDTRKTTP